ncbi:MAG: hypothetical protein NZQ09_17235 [Chloroflexus sp.]|nr:hypothetical protein [Chloroflexus sp.]
MKIRAKFVMFQSPHGDFGFLKVVHDHTYKLTITRRFQSPHGDFGFLKVQAILMGEKPATFVSIPSRGFWFFEGPPIPRQ